MLTQLREQSMREERLFAQSLKTYRDRMIGSDLAKKGEAHSWNWLYIEVNAGDLLTEVEAGADNMAACVEAIKDCMLEGDYFIVEADDAALSVRYYTDNLSEWRRKYSEVNG